MRAYWPGMALWSAVFGRVCPAGAQKIGGAWRGCPKVDGVGNLEVNLEKKEAQVTFGDAKTTVEALVEATTNAG